MTTIQETLVQRGNTYGDFSENARVSQRLEAFLRGTAGWHALSEVQKEALKFIVQKISRILTGNPDYKDNWHDIAGYATLAEQRCGNLLENLSELPAQNNRNSIFGGLPPEGILPATPDQSRGAGTSFLGDPPVPTGIVERRAYGG